MLGRTMKNPVPSITLNNGVEIPQLGFGTWQIGSKDATAAVATALEVGYRHIDTAQMYRNERAVGQAVRESGIDRDDVFITTKLSNAAHHHDDAIQSFEDSLQRLDLGHIDLFLVHWPLPGVGDYGETWKTMQELYRDDRCRAIGVSNFQPHHLQRLFDMGGIVPAVNQIEVHPFFPQDDVRSFGTERGIVTEAWSPLAQGKVADDPTIASIASRVERTPSQVALRWHLQRGDVVFPKSVTKSRVEENFAVFDFELSDDDVAAITALDRAERLGPHPDEFNWVP